MHSTQITDPDRLAPRTAKPRRRGRVARWGRLATAGAVSVLGAAALAGPAAAIDSPATQYQFHKLNNSNDPTFNQLLGINKFGVIAGYFGSGAQGHPNQGYLLDPPYSPGSFVSENFPGSVQTQVTGLNDRGVTVGFYSHQNNANLVNENVAFYRIGDSNFHAVKFPTNNNSTPPVNQLLGVNDRNVAVGFYTDSAGSNHAYAYRIRSKHFRELTIPGATSVTASAINNRNDIAGFETNGGTVEGFLLRGHDDLTTLAYPGATMTQPFGVNNRDEVVGAYTLGAGATATTHGFTWTPENGFQTVDDPDGIGTTTINGVNNQGQLVGFYVDAMGNTDGMLATPRS